MTTPTVALEGKQIKLQADVRHEQFPWANATAAVAGNIAYINSSQQFDIVASSATYKKEKVWVIDFPYAQNQVAVGLRGHVRVLSDTGVSAGDLLIPSSTAGQVATGTGGSSAADTIIGQAITANATGSAALIEANIY